MKKNWGMYFLVVVALLSHFNIFKEWFYSIPQGNFIVLIIFCLLGVFVATLAVIAREEKLLTLVLLVAGLLIFLPFQLATNIIIFFLFYFLTLFPLMWLKEYWMKKGVENTGLITE